MEVGRRLKDAPHGRSPLILAAIDPNSAAAKNCRWWRLTRRRKVAGFAVAALLPPQAELETIAVAAEGQRRGVGGRLFAELLALLRAEQVTEVILEVRASNQAALGLYQALGFLESGRRTSYYADPHEDAVLMGLRLG